MKTLEINVAQMDEIVFENRNKLYGAYILRKAYIKQLAKALLLSIAILGAGLAYPVVLSYHANKKARTHILLDPTTYAPTNFHKDVVLPPALPPSAPSPEKRVRLYTPVVTTEPIEDDGGLPDIEDIIGSNGPILTDVAPEFIPEKHQDPIEVADDAPPVVFVEEMPAFPGGDVERQKYLGGSLNYPQQAADIGIQGTVFVQFIVDTKGNITDVKLLRGIGGGCDEEALRVVREMPKWSPGKQNGRAVRVLYNMSISFKLKE